MYEELGTLHSSCNHLNRGKVARNRHVTKQSFQDYSEPLEELKMEEA
jgi:hypothetical protein